MKRSAIFSAILHIVILVILLVGIPTFDRQMPVNEMPIIMEFEKIADVSTAPVLKPEASIKEKKAPPKPEPKKEPEQPKEEPKPEEPKAEEQKQDQPKPEEKKVEEKKPEPKEQPKPEEKKPEEIIDEALPEPKKEKPKPEEKKPEPKKEPKKEPTKDSKKDPKKDKPQPTKAQVNLDPKKSKPKPLAKEKKKSVDDIVDSLLDASSDEEGSTKGAPASKVGVEVTATDIDAIRQQIAKCWIIPIGGQEAKELVVDLRMDIDKDGTVTRAEVLNKDRMSDPAFQAAAESAERAVLDPACNPLPLPPEKYEKWKRLTLRFNPKDMY